MALLNNTQSTNIYDNGSRIKKTSSVSGFLCFYIHGSLEGFNYYVDTTSASLSLTDTSTDTEIRDAVIAHLETQEYQGVKEIITDTVVELP